MEWNQLFLEKENWQRKTFEMIKQDLISARDNRFIRYDNAEENHLVMIYGKSQVGKTTLILDMIGLKQEYTREVHETLRAGVPKGNSSTSTAIIYAKSINNQYGCAVTSVNDASNRDIHYFDKNDMISFLIGIRQLAENNKIGTDSILYIYIPKEYFLQDLSSSDSISIMDMPGVESRNHREDIHVRNLMTKYIPLASVCIIACRSNEIQSLESLCIPNDYDWKRMAHRFIIVITHAYNDGNTKRYFRTSHSDRENSFYEYVVDAYTQEIRKILGSQNQNEVYPIDVGDTLTRLCNEEINNEDDRNEIISTKDHVLSDLKKAILSHKGERLKSALMDLDAVVKQYGENDLQIINDNISNYHTNIREKEKLIIETKDYLDVLNSDDSEHSEVLNDIESLGVIRESISQLLGNCILLLSDDVKQYIADECIHRDDFNGTYLYDKEKKVMSYIRGLVSEKVEEYIGKLNGLIGSIDLNDQYNISQIQINADSLVTDMQNSLYPPKKGFFSKKERVYLENIISICESIQSNINELLDGYVNDCLSTVESLITIKKTKIVEINGSISKQKEKISRYRSDILDLGNKISEMHGMLHDIQKKKEQDEQTLALYLNYAKQAYYEQRNSVIQRIYISNSPEDKLLLVLFLGLLDKDYQKVIGGIHESDN